MGVPEDDANLTANFFISSSLSGHDSHGVYMIPMYACNIRGSRYSWPTRMDVVMQTDTIAVLDGNWGTGQVIAQHSWSWRAGRPPHTAWGG